MTSTPLMGRTVIVTRDEDAGGELGRALQRLGANVVHVPLVHHFPSDDPEPLRRAASYANEFAMVVFTSARGVAAFAHALREEGKSMADVSVPIACVGGATAGAVEAAGGRVAVVARNRGSEGLVEELANRGGVKGKTILYPQASAARPTLADGLRAIGAEVTAVIAYRTEPIRDARTLIEASKTADAILFCSPSATEALRKALTSSERAALHGPALIGSMGPTTSEALRSIGIEPHFEPDNRSFAGFAEAVAKHLGPR